MREFYFRSLLVPADYDYLAFRGGVTGAFNFSFCVYFASWILVWICYYVLAFFLLDLVYHHIFIGTRIGYRYSKRNRETVWCGSEGTRVGISLSSNFVLGTKASG